MSLYDAIVIGGGPGGSSCAFFLAERGQKVLLLEKKELPREKFCAGGIPGSIFDILPLAPGDVQAVPVNEAGFTFRGKKPVHKVLNEKSIYSVERKHFDSAIIGKAGIQGAEILTGTEARGIAQKEECVHVFLKNGGQYSSKNVVIACGGFWNIAGAGMVRQGRAKTASCCYREIIPDKETMEVYQNKAHLDFGFFKKGVAGLMPKKNHLWVGVYTSDKVSFNRMIPFLDQFIKMLNITGTAGKVKGQFIPLYSGNRKLRDGKTYLVGESARLVNPLTGDGILPAVVSGKIAAECILSDKPESYQNLISSEIARELSNAWMFQRLAYAFPDIAYDGMTAACNDALEILNGRMSYDGFIDRLKKKIVRKIGGIIFPPGVG